MTDRARREDALKHIYKCQQKGRRPTLESIAGALHISTNDVAELLAQMQNGHLLHLQNDDIALTPAGMESALHIIRMAHPGRTARAPANAGSSQRALGTPGPPYP